MRESFTDGKKLDYKSLPISLKSLQRAIALPEEVDLDRSKPYPRPPNIQLMHNPFAAKKKGKKGKKK